MEKLWKGNIPYNDEENNFVPTLTAYPAAGAKGAVVVFPGGGYTMKAEHEGAVIGKWLQSVGVTAFTVDYRVAPYKHPAQISDGIRAVRWARHNAEKYGIDPNKIAVMGFSAGGHLAGSVSVHYDKEMYAPTDEIDSVSARPDASILCYSVIDMGEYRHDGSRQNLLGSPSAKKLNDFMSLHKQVDENTPEAFLWHTSTDQAVPVMNTLLYASALADACVPFELHVYPLGHHGLGLSPDLPYVAKWQNELDAWLTLKEWK